MASGRRYGVEIRAAQSTDAPELTRILGQVGVAVLPLAMSDRVDQFRRHDAAAVFVATGYGALTGLVALTWAPDFVHAGQTAHICNLVVDIDERRRGIGRLLLKAASQAARAAGCDVIAWAPGAALGDAEAFCRNTGFTPAGLSFVRSLRRRTSD